jgi:predicted DNA-binding transcriptional regulator AlpA
MAVGAKVERVEPDPFVSLAEIAARTGMSRAAMSLYAKQQRAEGFPAPVAKVTSNSSLYDWASVALWLFRHKKISRETAIEAAVVKEANEAIGAGTLQMRDRLKKRAGALEAEL